MTTKEEDNELMKKYLEQTHRSDEIMVGSVEVASGFLTLVDNDFMKHFYGDTTQNEMTDIPTGKVSKECPRKGHIAMTVLSEGYPRGRHPVYVQKDRNGHVISVRVSFIQEGR